MEKECSNCFHSNKSVKRGSALFLCNKRDIFDRIVERHGCCELWKKQKKAKIKGYTPGPWIPCEDGLVDKMVVGGRYDLIIDICHADGKRNNADAFLIAVAPEMDALLLKCKNVLEELTFEQDNKDLVEKANETIKEIELLRKKARNGK